MKSREKINSYFNSLLYATTRPHICEVVASSFDINRLLETDTKTKLLTLGALIRNDKFDDVFLLTEKLDFSDLTQDDKSDLAHSIFSVFSQIILSKHGETAQLATATLQLLVSIAPNAIMAHELKLGSSRQCPLINLNYSQDINLSISGVVFYREFMFGPGSRKHEFGYRIQSALTSQGWNVSLHPMEDILDYASSTHADFVIVDSIILAQMPDFEDLCYTLSNLKRYFNRIIIIECDCWTGLYEERLLAVSDIIDYVWGFTADWSLTKGPVFKGRSIVFPNVGGFDHLKKIKHADLDWSTCEFNFTGSVQGYNLNRAYWILESVRRNLPIKMLITKPNIDDGLDHESSLNLYVQSVASTNASLNLTTRKDGSRVMTGRSTEIISLNRLLIQETALEFQHYYVEGEHFLEFSNIEELSVIIDFLRSHPKTAKRICIEGHQFYLERYSCRKLVEHIQTWL